MNSKTDDGNSLVRSHCEASRWMFTGYQWVKYEWRLIGQQADSFGALLLSSSHGWELDVSLIELWR